MASAVHRQTEYEVIFDWRRTVINIMWKNVLSLERAARELPRNFAIAW